MLNWLSKKDAPVPTMDDQDCVEPMFTSVGEAGAPPSPDSEADFLHAPPQVHSVLAINRAMQTQPVQQPATARNTAAPAAGKRATANYHFDDSLIISEDEEDEANPNGGTTDGAPGANTLPNDSAGSGTHSCPLYCTNCHGNAANEEISAA
jgi:hypothetical protein